MTPRSPGRDVTAEAGRPATHDGGAVGSGEAAPVSVALIEVASIAVGYAVADALVKAAAVRLLDISPVSPGKLVILYAGDVASLEIAHAAGLARAGEDLVGELRLPRVHPQLFRALAGPGPAVGEALGILECSTVAAGWLAADAAAKEASVDLLEFRRAAGIGGKATILLSGSTADVAAALAAGQVAGEASGGSVCPVHIPAAHADLKAALAERWSRPGSGGA